MCYRNDPQEEIELMVPQDYKLYICKDDQRTPEAIKNELTERLSGLFDTTAVKGGYDSHGTFIHLFGSMIADYFGEYPDTSELEQGIQNKIDTVIDNF